jgi:hypothetical protein
VALHLSESAIAAIAVATVIAVGLLALSRRTAERARDLGIVSHQVARAAPRPAIR